MSRTAMAALIVLLACAAPRASVPLAVEVREYQGERLGSVTEFRENSIKGPQAVDSAKYRLTVTGLVKRPLSLALHEVLAYPAASKVTTLHCVEGWSVKVLWEGVRLGAMLDSAGVDSSANTVIFRAVDGYSTSLPLATVRGRDLMLAHRMNGVVMPRDRGYPLQLVAEDKWGYKWIRWLTAVELSADTSFRGYWEERGYNQDGEQSGPKLQRRYEPPPEP